MFLTYLPQYLPTVHFTYNASNPCKSSITYVLRLFQGLFGGSAMATSRRGDEYYRSLYAKEPDFHRLALQDADFKAMWDHTHKTRACCDRRR